MTIIQPTKPPDITPDKWTSEIWHYILKFLQPLDASFLFYSAINGAESLDANRKQEALNAANVDKIMQMQRNQFLAQASYLNFDPETQSPFKIKTPGGQQAQETMELANEAGVKIETINFIKLPPGLHGLKALQLALHELLCTMGKANYSATTSLVSITSETCGTDLLKRLNDTISPKSGDTTKQAKNKYTTHKDSFHDDTDFVAWWTTLLLLQTTKASLGIKDATHMDALDDACEIIEEKTGCSSRWSMEIMAWKIKCKSGAQSGDLGTPTTWTSTLATPQMPSRSPPSSTTCAYTSSAATPLESRRKSPTPSASRTPTTARGASRIQERSGTTTARPHATTKNAPRAAEAVAEAAAEAEKPAGATPASPRSTSQKTALCLQKCVP